MKIIFRIINMLEEKDKKKLMSLLIFSLLVSIVEVIGVSAIMPFVSLASDFSLVESKEYFRSIYSLFGFSQVLYFVIAMGLALIVFYVFRSLVNIYYFYKLAQFSEGQYAKLSEQIYSKNIYMKNMFFARQNTASLTKTIVNEAGHLTQVMTAGLFMISEVFIFTLLTGILLYMNWQATLIIFTLLMVVTTIVLRKVTKIVKSEGVEREINQNKLFQMISDSFGNFKLIKLFGVEKVMVENFASVTRKYVDTNITFLTFSHVPRLILDALGFGILILLVLILLYTEKGDIHTFIPMLTLYIVALYRMLPSLNRIISNYNKIVFYTRSLETIEDELSINKESLGKDNIVFSESIRFDDVNFSYEDKSILSSVNVHFKKGSKVAFVGESGSGKSTFIDLLMGLNMASSGKITIDKALLTKENVGEWRKKIGYIPQDVYLFDGTVADNIVFDREYNEERLSEVLVQSSAWNFLKDKDGLETQVGDAGRLLSGGQRQRIAIARALYGNPDILVLDEATSALDGKIEAEIMQVIYSLDKNITLFVVTHNKSITYGCDDVYVVSAGKLQKDIV